MLVDEAHNLYSRACSMYSAELTHTQALEARFGRGHDYTYVFPGMQKVVQAAGRVIRSETDTGSVLLLDARYGERRYRSLLPGWWNVELA